MTTTAKTKTRRHAAATTAETVAALFGDDGQRWETRDGRSLDAVARKHGARVEREAGQGVRYAFSDGSSLIATDGGWDLGISLDCWCWEGAGHSDECLERQAER